MKAVTPSCPRNQWIGRPSCPTTNERSLKYALRVKMVMPHIFLRVRQLCTLPKLSLRQPFPAYVHPELYITKRSDLVVPTSAISSHLYKLMNLKL